MVVMLNEKFRENVPAWEGFADSPDLIPTFFQRLFSVQLSGLKMHERTAVLIFFIHAFQSLENDAVSRQVLRLVQLTSWHSLSPGRLQVISHIQYSLFRKDCKRDDLFHLQIWYEMIKITYSKFQSRSHLYDHDCHFVSWDSFYLLLTFWSISWDYKL